MQVTEQIDALHMLRTNPIDYLATPRAIACIFMLPILTILGFLTGMAGGLLLSQSMYSISYAVFLNSVQNLLKSWDLVSALIKSSIFGLLIAAIGTTWGLTTTGGAKGVGESTTTAVVTALLAIFISNFFLSWVFFQGIGSTIL
jgi:phospholipid/cholesterol/gamma-HCH transport system permease protein